MIRPPPTCSRTDTLVPSTTLFRSAVGRPPPCHCINDAKHQKPLFDVFSRPQKSEKSPNYVAECEQLGATRLFRFRVTVHNRTQLPAPGQSPPIRTASFGTARTMNPVSWGRDRKSTRLNSSH